MDGKMCIYGYQTLNVFSVSVGQSADAATANADWNQEEAHAQAELASAVSQLPSGTTLPVAADVSGIGDRAAVVSGSLPLEGHSFNIVAIYLLKGATFVAFSDLTVDKPAPSVARSRPRRR